MRKEAAEVLSGSQRPHGLEVVEACGRLPITVAIAGGIVGGYGSLDEDYSEEDFRGLGNSSLHERITMRHNSHSQSSNST